MQITLDTLVADVAAQYPATTKVFERHGIDFCCGGRRPLGEVCREAHLDVEGLKADIAAVLAARPGDERSWVTASQGELIDHIVGHYHAKLREDLPRLSRLSAKVARVHGERHPEALELAQVYEGLRAELEPHMLKEEHVLFPFIKALVGGDADGHPLLGSAAHPIGAMQHEHDAAGEALARLRQLSGGFVAPADACNTFRGLYDGLSEVERDLHQHIHLENNVLFPRALEAERRALGRASHAGRR